MLRMIFGPTLVGWWESCSVEKRIVVLAATYVVVGFLTFGYGKNHWTCYNTFRLDREVSCEPYALMAGVFWPIYYAKETALWLTK